MKIGILQTGHPPDEMRSEVTQYASVFAQFLAGHGFDFAIYDVVDMVFPDSVTDCDGWLVTGSKHGAYEDHPFIPPLEEFVRDTFAADVPMVGVCFGHQIIAQALGGKVEKFRDGWAVGRQTYQWGGETIALNAWHQDQVVTLPEGAEVVAGNDFCTNAALVYGRNAFTVQPHPEFESDFVAGLVRYRGTGVIPAPLLEKATGQLDAANDNSKLAAMVAQFFRERTIT